MNLKLFFLFLISASFLLNAQEIETKKAELTGSLYSDSKILLEQYEQLPLVKMNDDVVLRKSPVLAGLLSAAVPGAGQFYNEDYWKAAIFAVLEGALITSAVIYNNKGDDQNAKFEAYADQYWSVVKYADWLIQYEYQGTNPGIILNRDPNLPTWEQVDFNSLNQFETGSHNLARHGEQQFYEMIGKYHQFSPGWDDFPVTQGTVDPISPHFTYYANERGKANDYYNIGDKLVLGVIINHAASVVEAILGANSYNNNLAVNFRVDDVNLVYHHELIPTMIVKYSF